MATDESDLCVIAFTPDPRTFRVDWIEPDGSRRTERGDLNTCLANVVAMLFEGVGEVRISDEAFAQVADLDVADGKAVRR